MDKSRILVTGVAGLLGSHLAERLIKDGHEVIGIDNMTGGYRDNVPEGLSKFVLRDLINYGGIEEHFEGVDIVYHCAAAAHEGLSVFSPYYINLNVYANTISVLSASIKHKVNRFVYMSSMARYGDQIEVPFREDMSCKPKDPYGIAKLAAEMQIRNLCETHGMEYVIAVPHNIIGARQKYDDPYRNVASIMANRMLQGKPAIIYGDGEQKRAFCFVHDVVDALVSMGFANNVVAEVINIGQDYDFITINELERHVAAETGFEGEPIYVKDRPQEVRHANCSADKARKLFGYKPTLSYKAGIRDIVEYVKSRGTMPFDYRIPLEIINDKTPETWKNKTI